MERITMLGPGPAFASLPSVVVMGVAGSGKTAVGECVAERLGWHFIEGDRFHPAENVARMASGLPLTDEHRWGWLDAVAAGIVAARSAGQGAVAACSALKRAYRDRLRQAGMLQFAYLEIDRETAFRRVGARKGHFMPASLIDSQFATLQPPDPEEGAIWLDARRPVDELADIVVRAMA